MLRFFGYLLLVLTVAAGCTDDAGDAMPSTTADDASTTSTASATPIPDAGDSPSIPRPTVVAVEPAMRVGDTRPLDLGPSRARLERYTPEAYPDVEEWAWQKLYHVDSDEVWTVVGEEGTPFWFWLAPDREVAIGIPVGYGDGTPPDQGTVLIDLETGELRQLAPFSFDVQSWISPGVVRASLSAQVAREQTPAWRGGTYELDIDQSTATLVSTERYFYGRPNVPVPTDSVFEPGVFEWRVDPDAGNAALVVRDDASENEQVIAERLANVAWSPDGRFAALVGHAGGVSLLNLVSGEQFELDPGAPYVFDVDWSPNGRYLVANRATPTVIFDVSRLGEEFTAGALMMVGTYEDAIFGDWGPADSGEALLLAGYCDSLEFRLERIDMASGATTSVPTVVGGFWVYDWSPRGDLVAVSSFELPRGFDLIDPVAGSGTVRPNLGRAVTSMQDVVWSASGEWILLMAIGGRDRCV